MIKQTTAFVASWRELYESRICTADEAVRKGIKSGDRIVFGHASAAPEEIARAIYEQRESFRDLKVFHMLYFGEAWHLREEMRPHLKPVANFLDKNSRPAYESGWLEFLPCHFHQVPELFTNGSFPPDVAAIQVSLPDENGYCSVGISNDYTKTAAEVAPVVIALVNRQMPYIGGDALVHVSELDYIVEIDRPLVAIPPPVIGEVEMAIARHCASIIRDGDTLQLGIGGIPDAVLQCLDDREGLGIHTEMFTDGVMHMLRKGKLLGEEKTIHPGKVVTTLILGTHELYEFLNNNPMIESYPVSYTNDPYVIGLNDNLVSINSCIEMDLMGQAASEAIGMCQFSGTGGQVDFLRGARRSRGGRTILAFRSTAQGGKVSRIVPSLPEGSTTTAGRNEVDYVATEYGIVRLSGKTLQERAELLISIAHPDFRPQLREIAQERFGSPACQ